MIKTARGSKASFERYDKRKSSLGGFTVIETLISILLLAITLAGGLSIYFNADRIVTLVGHKKIAVEIANSRMEELRRLDYGVFKSTYTLADPTVAQVFPDPNISPDPPLTVGDIAATRAITVEYVPHVDPPDYMEVRVKVSWTEANQTQLKEFEITSFIAP
ncbi:MAG: type II secretion system protein [Candidatus Omnitrophica bacterium]|nr:type II secretion system protein [Candidatus Omnitrophota bacterium]